MKTRDFFFDLPEELIAQTPPEHRGESRLLVYSRKDRSMVHTRMGDLPAFVPAGTCMVFNNTRVRKARTFGTSPSGGRFELVILRRMGPHDAWECLVRKSARLKEGSTLSLPGGMEARILGNGSQPGLKIVAFSPDMDDAWMEAHGHMPLPPYIQREDTDADASRYQTVYAGPSGSVAAPTAGLHFTPEILSDLDARGIRRKEVTLHVGLGTFLPVRTENIQDHAMHEEEWSIPADTAMEVNLAKAEGRKVLAVGTTSTRTLESAADPGGHLSGGSGATRIFLYPGCRFKVVDALFTNFHTPESTLLMLVSAFAGRDEIMEVYREAVRERYRFYSYGDAMLIL